MRAKAVYAKTVGVCEPCDDLVWLETLDHHKDRSGWEPQWQRAQHPYSRKAADHRIRELIKEGVNTRTVPVMVHRILY